jgi:hypothetical protein
MAALEFLQSQRAAFSDLSDYYTKMEEFYTRK